MLSALAGMAFGLSLIVAVGAQNIFVLRQGLRREHVGLVAGICAASDFVLISAGVGGLGALIQSAPLVVEIARWAGAAVVLVYGGMAAHRAVNGQRVVMGRHSVTDRTVGAAVATTLALTWLNPHVYLDTVVLVGGLAATHGDDRWWFGLGACVASAAWFVALAYGARYLAPLLEKPGAWRVLDTVVAATMLVVAVSLIFAT
ncbi:LysE/ArgO family amino acid transporter [Promicromonospora sp. NPDC057138]|uniref:LysE/ArgO family amino acid transporter n=1 Tax=Promicromonospora sp. NPDC057138 TaxID=3346031 RepID=UPI00363497CA